MSTLFQPGARFRRMNQTYYSQELLVTVRGATPEFRSALADQALQQLSNATGTAEHAKAVIVMACLGDDRLVDHLSVRLAENGLLAHYENHALIALGSVAAGDLFARSVLAVGKRLSGLPEDAANHHVREQIAEGVYFSSYDIRYLITPSFEPHLKRLIEDTNPDVSRIACDLAGRGLVTSLLYPATIAKTNRRGWHDPFQGDQRKCVTADLWLRWWGQSTDSQVRREMLGLLPPYPNAEVEQILMDTLNLPDLRWLAARGLGEYGAVRSAVYLRAILAEEITAGDHWDKSEAAHALGDLRDEAAVPLLEKVAREHQDDWVVRQAVSSLGLIGNLESERALQRLLQKGMGGRVEENIHEALLLCGSQPAVAIVVSRARARQDGPQWLCKRLRNLSWIRGQRRGEYRTHVHTVELVEYLEAQFVPGSPVQNWDVGQAFHQIDSPDVRMLLRKWAERRGSIQDPLVRENDQRRMSDICFGELRDRGDESAIEYTLDERADEQDDFFYFTSTEFYLRSFTTTAVAQRILPRLVAARTRPELGYVGKVPSPHAI